MGECNCHEALWSWSRHCFCQVPASLMMLFLWCCRICIGGGHKCILYSGSWCHTRKWLQVTCRQPYLWKHYPWGSLRGAEVSILGNWHLWSVLWWPWLLAFFVLVVVFAFIYLLQLPSILADQRRMSWLTCGLVNTVRQWCSGWLRYPGLHCYWP